MLTANYDILGLKTGDKNKEFNQLVDVAVSTAKTGNLVYKSS